jgi:Tfp pilus assembly protein PilN
MRAVNLLPRDFAGEGRKAPPGPVIAGCVGTVLVTALLAVLFLSASGNVAKQRRALESVQQVYANMPAPAPPSPVVSQLPKTKQTRVTALATALGQRVAWDRVLREVSQVVPSDVWLVTLDAQSPSYAPAATGAASPAGATLPQGFTVTGCTYSQDSVARFLARLQLVPDLMQMTLGKSESGSAGSGDTSSCPQSMFTFTLQGNIRVGGGPTS